MKIALRNFLQTLRRYKIASVLNIAGLTLAFAAFYIIMVQVWWELGYNRSLPEARRILLVNAYEPGFEEKFMSWVSRPPVERAIAASPDVEAWALRAAWWGEGDNQMWVRRSDLQYEKFRVSSVRASLSALEMFGYRTVDGDLEALARPNTVIVSAATARRCGLKIGSTVFVNEETPTKPFEVVGVFADFPGNTLLAKDEVLCNVGDLDIDQPGQWQYYYALKLRPGADPAAFCALWQKYYAEVSRERNRQCDDAEDDIDPVNMRLTPVTETYFAPDMEVYGDVDGVHGSWPTTLTLIGVAALVVVIAFINFVNFFFALIPVRLRAVNILKVYGAPTSALRFSFLFETAGLVVCSLLVAWYLAYFLSSTELANYLSTPLAVAGNLPVAGLTLAIALAMALVAGLYPAWYITSFSPAMAAKGSFAGSMRGRRMRLVLVGVQYVIAVGMIVAAVCMQRQHAYIRNFDLGFNRDNLLVFDVPSRKVAQGRDAFFSALESQPQVRDVACSSGAVVSNSTYHWGRGFKDKAVVFAVATVSWNFPAMMGFGVYEGRDFLPSDEEGESCVMIANRAAQRAYGIGVGDTFDQSPESFVGFCPDTHFVSLYHGVCPFVFCVRGKASSVYYMSHYYLRTTPDADLTAVREHIQQCVDAMDPTVGTVDVRPFEQELGELYDYDRRTATLITALSLLAIVIALMGVFGVVLFETQHRRREIAVRKVMGATTGEVLRMFNARYVRIVVVCALLALPVSIWAVQRWVSVFAYRAPMPWWVFALAVAAVLAVTVLTVTFCTWRAANENPAESVKSE